MPVDGVVVKSYQELIAVARAGAPAEKSLNQLDAVKLRDDFHWSHNAASRCARWCAAFPGAEPNTCRYCGKHWRQWRGSKLDGHAACFVTKEFKQELVDLLRDPRVTFKAIADAIGMTPAVVRSWTFPVTCKRTP